MTDKPTFDLWPTALLATTLCAPIIPVLAFAAFDLLSGASTEEWLRRVRENLPALALVALLFGIVPSFVSACLFAGITGRYFGCLSRAWFPIWMILGAAIGSLVGPAWIALLVFSVGQEVTIETFTGGSAWGAIAGAGGALIFKGILFARMPRWGRAAKSGETAK